MVCLVETAETMCLNRSCRFRWIRRAPSSPPAARTKTSPSLTTGQESASPPCSAIQVSESLSFTRVSLRSLNCQLNVSVLRCLLRAGHLYQVQSGLQTPDHGVRRQVSSAVRRRAAQTDVQESVDRLFALCSCVFVWRLDAQMTSTMRKRRGVRLTAAPETHKKPNIR